MATYVAVFIVATVDGVGHINVTIEKLSSIDDRGQTDRITVAATSMTFTFNHRRAIWSWRTDTHTNFSSKVSWFKRWSGNKRTDGRTDRRTPPIALPFKLTRSIITRCQAGLVPTLVNVRGHTVMLCTLLVLWMTSCFHNGQNQRRRRHVSSSSSGGGTGAKSAVQDCLAINAARLRFQPAVSPITPKQCPSHWWPFRSFPVNRLYQRPRQMIGSLWLPIYV